MRRDMKDLLQARGRRGSQEATKGRSKEKSRSYDEDASRSEAIVPRKIWIKERSTTNLAPLKRWLNSQVGRTWYDIWHDVCKNNKWKNYRSQEVRDWVNRMVDVTTCLNEDNKVINDRCHEVWDLYVDPTNGKLCKNNDRPRWKQKKIDDSSITLSHNGKWFKIYEKVMSFGYTYVDKKWFLVQFTKVPAEIGYRIVEGPSFWIGTVLTKKSWKRHIRNRRKNPHYTHEMKADECTLKPVVHDVLFNQNIQIDPLAKDLHWSQGGNSYISWMRPATNEEIIKYDLNIK